MTKEPVMPQKDKTRGPQQSAKQNSDLKSLDHFTSIDQYIACFSGEIRIRLETICQIVQEIAPEAEGKISYNMPAYFLGADLSTFAFSKGTLDFILPVWLYFVNSRMN
jgi:hypothetical protein